MSTSDRDSGILNREEQFSLDERAAYQRTFLRDIVTHAYGAGTPLKMVMDEKGIRPDDIQSVEDLAKLPVTKKSDLVNAQAENPPFGGFCTVPPSELARIHRSPGPIYDPVGRVPDYWRWKVASYAVGFRPGDIVMNTFAYHLTPAGHMFDEGVVELGVTVVPTGVGNTETQVEVMRDLGVTGYVGTPSFLMAILQKAEEMGVNVNTQCRLQIAFLLAEMFPQSMRRRLREEYALIGRQAYGTADLGAVTYECPQENGMHIHFDCIVEIADPETGEPLPDGSVGEVVVTTNNRIYPLVRFGTGDLSSIDTEPCPCGRTGPRITGIKGRADQVTKVKGMFVHPSQVAEVIKRHPAIGRGRLVVDRVGDRDIMTLEIEVEGQTESDFDAAVGETIREVCKLKGDVKKVAPGTLPEEFKTIEDVRKWD